MMASLTVINKYSEIDMLSHDYVLVLVWWVLVSASLCNVCMLLTVLDGFLGSTCVTGQGNCQ